MNIAIIPARGGSKRILNKNIKKFHGKPIIAWTIECAVKSNLFDKIIVSTDDKKIARVVKKIGAEVPFIRPKNLSQDTTPSIDVVIHAINEINELERTKIEVKEYIITPINELAGNIHIDLNRSSEIGLYR